MQFSAIKKKHGIIPSDIIDSESISFAQAVNNILEYAKAKDDKALLEKRYRDACSIALSDGFCAPCEARILYAMRSMFFRDPESGIRLIDCKESSIKIDGPKVFFVREGRHADLSKNFIEYFQEYYYEFMNFGFELINIVQICNDLISMGEDNVVELMSLGRPNIIKPRASAIYQKLKAVQEVGLGYLTLGQPCTTLSGGESQRIKLATELAKRETGRTLYILDEPTTGLHFEDIRQLLDVINRLVDCGNTAIVIEHNLDVIRNADHIIDMGPEGGRGGGMVVAEGTPDDIARSKESFTGEFLAM